MAKRMQLGEAEFLFASNATKFLQEMQMIDQALETLYKEYNRVDAMMQKGMISAKDGTEQLTQLTNAFNRLSDAQKKINLGPQLENISQSAGKAKLELSAIAHTLDDLQYVGQMGLQPIINNLVQMSSTVGLVALGAFQLYKNWDSLVDLMTGSSAIETEAMEMERLAKATALTADEARRLSEYKRDEAAAKHVEGMDTKDESDQQKAFNDVYQSMTREERENLVSKIIATDPGIRQTAEIEMDQLGTKEGPNFWKRQWLDSQEGMAAMLAIAGGTFKSPEERVNLGMLDEHQEMIAREAENMRQGRIDQRTRELAFSRIGKGSTDPATLNMLTQLDPRFAAASVEGRAADEAIKADEKENEKRAKATAQRRARDQKAQEDAVVKGLREEGILTTTDDHIANILGAAGADATKIKEMTKNISQKNVVDLRAEALKRGVTREDAEKAFRQDMIDKEAKKWNDAENERLRDLRRERKQDERDERGETKAQKEFKKNALDRASSLFPGMNDAMTQLMVNGRMNGMDGKAMEKMLRDEARNTLMGGGMPWEQAVSASFQVVDKARIAAEEKLTDIALKGPQAKPYRHQKIDMAAFGDQILTMGGGDPEQDQRTKSYNAMINAAVSLKNIETNGIRARMAGGQR